MKNQVDSNNIQMVKEIEVDMGWGKRANIVAVRKKKEEQNRRCYKTSIECVKITRSEWNSTRGMELSTTSKARFGMTSAGTDYRRLASRYICPGLITFMVQI